MKKELLPYTFGHYLHLRQLKKETIKKYQEAFKNKVKTRGTAALYAQIHDVVEKLYEYDNVVYYNRHASNRCRFYNSDESEEVCERFFNNTLNHFSVHGNCCQSCSNLFNSRINIIKPKTDTEDKEEIEDIEKKEPKYFINDFIPRDDID